MAKTKAKQKAKAKQTTDEAQYYREIASDSYSKIETSYLDLAEALFQIKKEEYYRSDYGAKTFADYCRGELGIKYGKANSLVRIWEGIRDFELDKSKLADIGWTKARLVMSAADKDNIDDLLEAAKNKPVEDLKDYISSLSGEDKKPAKSGLSVKFKAGSSESKVATEALELAMNLCETKDAGTAFAFIATQWMTESGIVPEKVPLETVLSLLEKTYGGKITYEAGEDPEESEYEETEEDESDEDTEDDDSEEYEEDDSEDDEDEDFDEEDDEEE